jgi:predicted nucleic acid-binding protein
VNYLIDTNIISQIRKKSRCDRNVAAWYASIEDDEVYLSMLVVGEIRQGVELARRRNRAQAGALERVAEGSRSRLRRSDLARRPRDRRRMGSDEREALASGD